MPNDSLVDAEFLGDLDEIRGIAGELGLRVYGASVLVTTWTAPAGQNARPGFGTKSQATLPFTNTAPTSGDPNPSVRVRQLKRQEIVSSGGKYTDRDMKIGPITPAFAARLAQYGGGFSDPMIDPEQPATPVCREIHWILTGPSFPAAGAKFSKIGEEATALHYNVIVRQTGEE
jgi:hypothetical protein